MTARKYRTLVLLVVVLSLITSACFQIRKVKMTPDALAVGDRGLVTLDLFQLSDGQINTDGYPFLLIGFNETDLKLKTVSVFDVLGNFGGSFDRVNDAALRALLLSAGNCTFNGIDASAITGLKWWAYRTSVKMDSTAGTMADPFRVKLAFERVGGANNGSGEFVVFSGTWGDVVVNGIPEAGETSCFSMAGTSFAHKP